MELLFRIGGFVVEAVTMLPLIELRVHTLIHTLIVVMVKLPITKPIRILNLNSVSVLNAGI